MDKREKLTQMARLAQLSEVAWESAAFELALLKNAERGLIERKQKVDAVPDTHDISGRLAGMDVARDRWREMRLKKINLELANLKVEIDAAQDIARRAFGRKSAVGALLDKQIATLRQVS